MHPEACNSPDIHHSLYVWSVLAKALEQTYSASNSGTNNKTGVTLVEHIDRRSNMDDRIDTFNSLVISTRLNVSQSVAALTSFISGTTT